MHIKLCLSLLSDTFLYHSFPLYFLLSIRINIFFFDIQCSNPLSSPTSLPSALYSGPFSLKLDLIWEYNVKRERCDDGTEWAMLLNHPEHQVVLSHLGNGSLSQIAKVYSDKWHNHGRVRETVWGWAGSDGEWNCQTCAYMLHIDQEQVIVCTTWLHLVTSTVFSEQWKS